MKLVISALTVGGDGIARDATGRVTFVPRTAPGDVVEVTVVSATKSYARAQLVRVVEAGWARVEPACPHFARGCGGCAWQHVAYPAQLAAKQAIVANALRKLAVTVHDIAAPAPLLGWRRRARFHVEHGAAGLYVFGTHALLPIDHCPQLEPALDPALAGAHPDGELAIALGHRGDIAIGAQLVELEPGLWIAAADFAQASAAANAALIACARAALGPGPGEASKAWRKKHAAKHAEQPKQAIKCDMCSGIGGGPACVRACPTGAAIRVAPEGFLSVARMAEGS